MHGQPSKNLSIPQDSGLYLGPTPREETVFSDLLPVRSLPQLIYTARTAFDSRKAIFNHAGPGHSLSGCWTVHGKVVYSFEDLSARAWNSYCEEGTIEEHSASFLADSEVSSEKKIFVELLNFTLKSQLYDQDLGYYNAGYFYQKPDPGLGQRTATYSSRLKKATRVMFSGYKNRDGSAVSFYRHAAFRSQFYRFSGKWFLQVIPTYHFTSDGYRISPLAGRPYQVSRDLRTMRPCTAKSLCGRAYSNSRQTGMRNHGSYSSPILSSFSHTRDSMTGLGSSNNRPQRILLRRRKGRALSRLNPDAPSERG